MPKPPGKTTNAIELSVRANFLGLKFEKRYFAVTYGFVCCSNGSLTFSATLGDFALSNAPLFAALIMPSPPPVKMAKPSSFSL